MKTTAQTTPVKTNRPLEIIGGDSKTRFIHYADGACELYFVAKGKFREDTIIKAECIIELARLK